MEWNSTGKLPYLSVGFWVIAITSDGNIWTHNCQNELYFSTNNGDEWEKRGNLPMSGSRLEVNPVNGHLFFTGELFHGLFRSTDNGENWENILKGIAVNGIFFTASGEMYVGCQKQAGRETVLYYSKDDGNTWIGKGKTLPAWFCPLATGKDGTLYAISSMGVYHSIDGGDTWISASNYSDTYIRWLTICDDGSLFATSPYVAVLRSKNKGVNWTQVNTGIEGIGNYIMYLSRIIYNPVTKDIFFTTRGDFFRADYRVYMSIDLGKNWTLENTGLPNEFGILNVNRKTGQMFMSMESGIYHTKNYPR
jgi:hypothetical protein